MGVTHVTGKFDLSAIARHAHRIARLYAPAVGYRRALSWGFKEAWKFAKGVAEIERRDAAMSAEARTARDEAIVIECSTDGAISAANRARLDHLNSEWREAA
jgi:hypothetical protein